MPQWRRQQRQLVQQMHGGKERRQVRKRVLDERLQQQQRQQVGQPGSGSRLVNLRAELRSGVHDKVKLVKLLRKASLKPQMAYTMHSR